MLRLVLAGMATLAVANAAVAEDIDWTSFKLDGYEVALATENSDGDEVLSGLTFRTEATRSMQEDDFENPAMWRVDEAAEAWETADGMNDKSCADCHGDAAESMIDAATTYPKVDEETGELMALEHRINNCRTENMGADAWKWESDPLLNMTIFVKNQGRGLPVNVASDGVAAEHWEAGKELYYQRIGQLDMACKHCHEDNYGNYIRADMLSQGQSNGFPTYRHKWNKVGSIHRRIRGCMGNIRATKFPYGSYENTALELYLATRGNGLPVETPSVRN